MKNRLSKRICAMFSALCMIAAVFPVMAVQGTELSGGIMSLLSKLEIMQGDPSGDMRLDDTVTRAEFTKAAVAASAYKDMVATHLAVSPFMDVTYKHWSAPYVRVGVTNGLVSGYPDASFRPDENVLYEEAVTIMLRVLGYTDSDFGAAWPYGQLGLADNLDMTDDIGCSVGEAMTRSQVAQLIYNTLSVNQKGQSAKLISIFNAEIKEDITLIADSSSDSSIASDEIYTDQGSLKIEADFDSSNIGLKGDAAVKNGNKLIAFIPGTDSSDTKDYVVYSVLADSVMAYHGSTLAQLNISDSVTAYKGKTQTTFSALKQTLESGDRLKIKETNGNIDYITWQEGNMAGPVTVTSSAWGTGWGVSDSTTVMRNGLSSSVSDIKAYDVVYYLTDLDMVLAYSDKITGLYENATPTKDMPTSVTISGSTYTLEGGSAFAKLASGGNFDLGDTITALLGKDGTIVDVISPDSGSDTLVGYIIATGRKEYTTGVVNSYTSYYINVVLPDGTSTEYTTNKDYSSGKNKVAKISFDDGNAVLDFTVENSDYISGNFDWDNKKLGKTSLSRDLDIIDIGTTDADDSSTYITLFPQRLDGMSLSANQILYAEKNSNGEITKLILKDVTGDAFSYGIMISAEQSSERLSGSYEYIVDGQIYNLNTSSRLLNISTGAGIKIGGNASNPDSVSKLNQASGKVKSLTASSMIVGTTTYPISGNVSVYKKTISINSTYNKIPLSDIIGNQDEFTITGYYDKAPSAGGQIRVIVVQ